MRDDTRIQLNRDQEYSARKLSSGFKRGTIIVDSCRNVRVRLSLNESVLKYAKAHRFAEDPWKRQRHRNLFDRYVAVSDAGPVFLFGCEIGQSAQDYHNGGAFSFSFLDAAETWASRNAGPAGISVATTFHMSIAELRKEGIEDQKPVIDGAIRKKDHFPFAVVTP